MTTIHHATAKRAATLGFDLAMVGSYFHATRDGDLWGHAATAKLALDDAIANFEAGTPVDLERRSNLARTMSAYRHTYIDETNGDQIAAALIDATTHEEKGRRVLNRAALREVCNANGLDLGRWDHLNNGQQRMCAGNALRGMFRRGTTVVIGTARFVPVEADQKAAA